MKIVLSLILFLICNLSLALDRDFDQLDTAFLGAPDTQVAGYHRPTYLIFGKDDLKLQFSFKYRIAKNLNLYFAHTQTMFWNIYDESKPFYDISFNPELFYRVIDNRYDFFRSVDMGYMHLSNGKGGNDSRSMDRVFLRSNILTEYKEHLIGANIMLYKLYNFDRGNKDIQKYMGYWDVTFFISNILKHEKQSLDLELRLFSGSKILKPSQGAYQVGLIYDFNSDNFNPMIYLQYYKGYVENVLSYYKKTEQLRLGLLLTF